MRNDMELAIALELHGERLVVLLNARQHSDGSELLHVELHYIVVELYRHNEIVVTRDGIPFRHCPTMAHSGVVGLHAYDKVVGRRCLRLINIETHLNGSGLHHYWCGEIQLICSLHGHGVDVRFQRNAVVVAWQEI